MSTRNPCKHCSLVVERGPWCTSSPCLGTTYTTSSRCVIANDCCAPYCTSHEVSSSNPVWWSTYSRALIPQQLGDNRTKLESHVIGNDISKVSARALISKLLSFGFSPCSGLLSAILLVDPYP